MEGYSAKYLTSTPQNCQGHQEQKFLETVAAKRNPRRNDLGHKCNVVSWMESLNRKGTRESRENLNKAWTLVNNNPLILIYQLW